MSATEMSTRRQSVNNDRSDSSNFQSSSFILNQQNNLPSYNPSIVELRPFNQEELNRLARNRKPSTPSTVTNATTLNTSNFFNISNTTNHGKSNHFHLPPVFNKRNLPSANSNNQRRYLVNKNTRFYEPIRDAEMLSQLDRLRTKLVISKTQSISDDYQPRNIANVTMQSQFTMNKSRTSAMSKTESYDSSRLSQNVDDTNVIANTLETETETIQVHENEKPKNNNSDNKVVVTSLIEANKNIIEEMTNCNSDDQDLLVLDHENSNLKINNQRSANPKVPPPPSSSQLNVAEIKPSMYKRNLNDFDDYVNESVHSLNYSKTSIDSFKHHPIENYHTRYTPATTHCAFRPNKVLTPLRNASQPPHSNPLNPKLLNKKVRQMVRRSTKSRFENIYKTSDSLYSMYLNQTSNEINTVTTTSTSAPLNNNTTSSTSHSRTVSAHPKQQQQQQQQQQAPQSASTHKTNAPTPTDEDLAIYPPNRRLHPSLRHQYLKEGEPPSIENIINDIPSTIKMMSQKGKVTNIEKLIAVKLSDYYTNYRLVY